ELGEIEAVLASAPGVVHAAATVVTSPTGEEQLVGYLAPSSVDMDAVNEVLSTSLPQYMRPSVWVALDEMPLNTAGKVARRELPQPELRVAEFVAPATESERIVAGVFAEVLGVGTDQVGALSAFFDLGGNSLSATRAVARVADLLAADISVRDLFDAPTVRALAAVADNRGAGLAPVTAVDPRPDRVPLSFAQQRMWFINRFDASSPAYNIPAVLTLSGTLDVDALRRAVLDVVARHEILRTTFPAHDGVPHQQVVPATAAEGLLDWAVVDRQADIEAAVMTGFDVSVDLPLRVRLWPVRTGEHVLAVVAHHIAADGESMVPLVTDVVTAYAARTAGRAPLFVPLEVQFADYALWQHAELGSADDPDSVVGRQLAYWTGQLAGLPDALDLPTDRPRPPVASQRGAQVSTELPTAVADQVAELARAQGVTPFMVVHAALAVLFARLSGTDDIAIATPVAGRGQRVLDPLVGMFVNTLVLRTQVAPGASFRQVLEQVRAADLDAFGNVDVPFESLVEALNPVRSEAFSPLAQVMLTFNDASRGASIGELLGGAALDGLTLSPVEPAERPAQLDLNVVVSAAAAGQNWHIATTYATDLFDSSTVEAMNARFVAILDELSAVPDRVVGDVALLGADERMWTAEVEYGAQVALPAVATVADAVAERIAAEPDRVALVFGEREVTFAEFGARVNSLARRLIEIGVGPDVAVALCIPRSVEMMVAIHAVVAAGGQYVPVDTAAPSDRIRYMLETSAAAALLVADAAAVPDAVAAAVDSGAQVLGVDAATEITTPVAPITDAERRGPLAADNAVYTLFTSGSTGRPKGVTLTHEAVLNRLWWGLDALPIDSSDVVVQKTTYTFDCSVPELFAPLIIGARTVVLRDGGHLDPGYVADEIARTRATMVHFVPSMLSVFLEVVGPERVAALDTVRIVSTTGEALPPAVAATVRRLWPSALFFNLYGPTEAAVEITFERIEQVSADDPTVPIGVPVWNSSAVVLDARLHRVPVGVPGELYLGGIQLARGYAARPDLTAERFVADPYGEPGARLYRTGDLVKRTADGGIEYLGRTDFQVKLRGQRIELGEIESVIAAGPGVVHAAATVATAPGGGEHLVAYLSGAPGTALQLDAVKSVVSEALPEYMRPTVWMVLEDIALNTAGKIDRRSLPEPEFTAGDYVAPEGTAEVAVAQVFAEVLGVDQVSATDSFFDLGGNSLSAMRLAARVGISLGVDISVRELFDAPSVRALVASISDADPALVPVTAVSPRPDVIPLAFAQQRMWFINQMDPTQPTYNIPIVRRVSGELDVDALHAAMIDVVTRHEILRTTFPVVDGVPTQKIARANSVAARLDWSIADSIAEVEEAALTGFDVTTQWPIRIRLHRVGPTEYVFAVITHHIASDGESMLPLLTDLTAAYLAEVADRDPEFEPMAVQFADYAIWQRTVLGSPDDPDSIVGKQMAYWRGRLAGLPDVIELPTDRPRPAAASGVGRRLAFEIPAETGRSITELAHRHGVTSFMVVHAALSVVLARLAASEDIAIGTPIANRGRAELDPLIGMFVNTLILRARVNPELTVAELLAEIKRADLDAYANADVPFEAVVEATGAVRSAAFAPFSQVWLTFDQSALPELGDGTALPAEIGGLDIVPMTSDVVPARVDLMASIVDAAEGVWYGSFIYAVDLFDESTVASMADHLVTVLGELTADADRRVGELRIGAGLAVADLARERQAVSAPVAAMAIADSDAIVTGGPGTAPRLLAEIFADAARTWGPRQAVIDTDGAALTYTELDVRSNRLAHWLIGQGIGPEKLVALAIGRSAELLTAIWAVAKTGAGYVPIDPDYPAERVLTMIEDSGAGLGLTVTATGDLPGEAFDWLRLDEVAVAAAIAAGSDDAVTDADRLGTVDVANIAYVIYTSGSTGRPKGVAVTHSGLANFAAEEIRRANADEYARVLGFASPSFDASVLEYLLATVSGGVLIYRPTDAVGGAALGEHMMRQAVTHTFLTPSVLATLDPQALPALRVVYAGGEAVPQTLKDQWAPLRRIQNLYGPTETTIGVTISAPMGVGEPITLGGPLAGVGLMVLDNRLRPVPVGVPGELYVCGGALSRGYLDRPSLTAERFVVNPHGAPGDRMYRTGDVVRWRRGPAGDAVLEYSGRSDDQVKLRGLRIELGEIEAVLGEYPGVRSAVVVGVGGSVATALAGYVVADAETFDVAQARTFLAGRLPAHMVPASIQVLDALPMTPVGKLDKQALPAPVLEIADFVAPETDTESAVAAAYAEVLGVGVDEVSVTADFFDLGGNSLSATRLAARVAEVIDAPLSVRDVFEFPSIRSLIGSVDRTGGDGFAAITPTVPRPDRVPLSFAQQRMWFINQFDTTSPTYNVPIGVRVRGAFDVAVFHRAVLDVVARHEILRTTFPSVDGSPVQVVHELESSGGQLDWAVVSSAEEVEAAVTTGFDVSTEWPVRGRIWPVADDEWVVVVVAHHIAADGESMAPLLNDLMIAYAARSIGVAPEFPALDIQFADYALWQHRTLGSVDDPQSIVGAQLQYWAEQLDGLPDVLELPADRPRPRVASQHGARVDFRVPAELADRVTALAREKHGSTFMVIHAALAVLLARLSATDDIAIGTPIAGRGRPELDPLVGMFVNTLVLRTKLDADTTFDSVLEQVRHTDLDAFAHADVPFETLVEKLDPVRSEAFAPLSQVWLTLDQTVLPEFAFGESADTGGGLDLTPIDPVATPAKVDLLIGLTVGAAGQVWDGSIVYATDLFDAATVELFAQRLVVLLDELTAAPASRISAASLLSADERAQIDRWSDGAEIDLSDPQLAGRPVHGTLADLVTSATQRFGDSPAVTFGTRTLTFAELSSRVNTLARQLIKAGVGPDVAVGVCIPRSVEMVVALHAVVVAGGQYVPIDTGAPTDRVAYMLEISRAAAVVVAASAGAPGAVAEAIPADVALIVVDSSTPISDAVAPVTDDERHGVLREDNAAYTIFTSGSTGRPKGVTVSHRSVMSQLIFDQDYYAFGPDDVFLQVLDYTFDPSVLEFFRSSYDGGRLVMMRPGEHRDPWAMATYVSTEKVTSLIAVPSMLSSMLEALGESGDDLMSSVRHIHTGGEALPPAVADRLLARWPAAGLHNQYGPTEATIFATISEVITGRATVPIGIPLWHVSAHVLDSRLQVVPIGVPGELYLGGLQVARGYASRPGLTAERFVADPFNGPGSRLYRTGDLVAWNADGQLEYLGRSDFQVKLRGQRIELGEIEAVLAAAPGVVHAAVTVDRAPSGGELLVAYVDGTDLDRAALADYAAGHLVEFMQPAVWVILTAMPVSTAGKVDRKSLPEPDFGTSLDHHVEAATDTERSLAAIVGGLLGLERVSVTESFFALGGDSIMSIQLTSAARAAGLALSPRQIFELKTIRAMAAVSDAGVEQMPMLAESSERGVGRIELPPIVGWMLELSDDPTDFADFSQSRLLIAPNGSTLASVTPVLAAVVDGHPMLTASLRRIDGEWVLATGGTSTSESKVAPSMVAPSMITPSMITEVNTDASVDDPRFDEVVRAAHARACGRLDPAAGALVQAVLIHAAAGEDRLLLVIHHLGVDAVSWPILIEDLITVWSQDQSGVPAQIRREETTAQAWHGALAAQAEERAGELDHWLARTPQRPTDLGVALDRDRDREANGVRISHRVAPATTEAVLTTVPEAFGAVPGDVLLAALARAVRGWQVSRGIDDQDRVVVLSESHGRHDEVVESGPRPRRADLSRTVGWFTSIAPVSLEPSIDMIHAVKAAKEERLTQPGAGVGFGLLRYRGATPLTDRPLPSIAFNFFGAGAARRSADPTHVVPYTVAAEGPALPPTVTGAMMLPAALSVNVSTVPVEGGRSLVADVSFAAAVLSADAVADLMARWEDELAEVVANLATVGDPGPSPSDVAGVTLTQDDLDVLGARYPGAAIWPLSPLQRGLYFQAELTAGTDAGADVDVYLTQAVLTLGGRVDPARLRRAAADLIDHHRVLRTGYVRTGTGAVVAVVAGSVPLPWTVIDLGDVAEDAREGRIRAIADEQRLQSFDMTTPPLIRFVLVEHGQTATLVVTNHHILLDGWSGPLVLADMLALYARGTTFTGQHAPQGGDFETYLRHLAATDHDAGLRAWGQVLAPLSEPTLVASDVEVTAEAMPRDRDQLLDVELAAGIERLARERGVTVTTIMQFAWAVLLSRMTGNRVVAFGETVSGRPADLDGVEYLVGLFINTLPVVVDLAPETPIGDVLEQMQAQKVSVLDHQHIGLPEIIATGTLPTLFDTLTVHESYPVDNSSLSTADADLTAGLQIIGVDATDATHYPLNLATAPVGNTLSLKVKYLPSAFDDDQVDTIAHTLVRILEAAVDGPDVQVGDIGLLSMGEAAALSPVSGAQAPSPRLTADVFAEVARRHADNVAVTDADGGALTYAELDARSNQLARGLVESGVQPESIVALALGRSVELVTAYWAVAKIGAAYLPIDPGYPADRIAHMISDAQVEIGITTDDLIPELPGEVRWTAGAALRADDSGAPRAASPIEAGELPRPRRLDAPAYVIYTSGSTGVPKGVVVTYRGLYNFAAAEVARLRTDAGSRVLGFASPSFDASVLEWMLASMVGATLTYRPDDVVGGAALADFIAARSVSHVFLTPSVLSSIGDVELPELKVLAAGGEAVPTTLADKWAAQVSFHNAYGPTEASVALTLSAARTPGRRIDIGGPIAGVELLVLDDRLRPVPIGFPGELYAAGVGLARGYHRRPALTAQAFVADPYGKPGAVMYRTGDIVRWVRADSGELVIEYVGRGDDQVKLRGLRIELGEIEAALTECPGVASAVVIGVGGAVASALAAYVVLDDPVEVTAIREQLTTRLPVHMVPSTITVLDALPLTPVGKLDKRALPAPVIDAAVFVAPDGEAETLVTQVFVEVLGGIAEVSVTASFFELGGNSLSATRLAARVSDVLDADVSVRDVFEAPTVRELAGIVAGRSRTLPPVTAISPRPEQIPLSFAQQRMWFINQFDTTSAAYNIPIGLRLTGDLDVAALQRAIVDVIARHEILRTTFPASDPAPVQFIHAPDSALARPDWQVVTDESELLAATTRGFDVTVEVPLRIRLYRAGEQDWILLAVLHHIIGDGESMVPLVTDMVTAYVARIGGDAPEFAAMPVQFADYAIWQHTALGDGDDPESVVGTQLRYWTRQLANVPEVLELPADRPRPPVASHRGAMLEYELPAEIGARIGLIARAHGVTDFMVLHAALSVLLARLSATDDITVATPVAGRGQADLDQVIGMFVNTLILRTPVDPGMSFTELLAQVRGTDLEAFANAEVPFETVVDKINPTRSTAFAPLAQVMLLIDQPAAAGPVFDDHGVAITPLDPPAVAAQVDLTFSVTVTESAPWICSVIYATDLYDEDTVRTLINRFVNVLDATTSAPAQPVGQAPIVSDTEIERIVAWSSGSPRARDTSTLATLLVRARTVVGAAGDGDDPNAVPTANQQESTTIDQQETGQ
ncbi:amino acid adenylation domain-containing protein, partial [Gordonia sp. ABSL1-1]|uniref:amino acid adenylation domain-containing protein n=1 Tax=Gordonia sp. ABSL1-1 TaxID=3053923 RepID=UPI0033659DC4